LFLFNLGGATVLLSMIFITVMQKVSELPKRYQNGIYPISSQQAAMNTKTPVLLTGNLFSFLFDHLC